VCTIVLLHRVAELPLVVAANRDELYARATEGPQLLAPGVVGGRDLLAGGTWMGVTASGLFVGVTNQKNEHGRDKTLRSRGQLVLEALRRGSMEGVRTLLADATPTAYNELNLVYGDGRELEVAYARHDRQSMVVEPVPAGVHVLPNDVLDSAAFPKVARVRELLGDVAGRGLAELEPRLVATLGDAELPRLETVPPPAPGSRFDRETLRRLHAICIHTPLYGSRSATIAALAPGRVVRYLFAPGPPDREPFADHLALLGDSA
jgi:uncharacterized protein with NRDE domain